LTFETREVQILLQIVVKYKFFFQFIELLSGLIAPVAVAAAFILLRITALYLS
jgi:hypothetical protein